MESGQGSSSVSLRHEIRITSQGKIKNWVTYALDFFEVGNNQYVSAHQAKGCQSEQKEPDTPLVLHTLPSSRPPQQEVGTATAEDPKKPDTTDEAKTPKKQKLPSSTATIPRLISVAEIIKREYLKKLDPANSDTGSLYGLHQYNEIGHLEEAEPSADDEEDLDDVRQREITLKLQGKNQWVVIPMLFVTLTRLLETPVSA